MRTVSNYWKLSSTFGVFYIAVDFSVVQCIEFCCIVLQCIVVCPVSDYWSPSWIVRVQCVAVCCSVLQCVAVRCSALQCAAVCCSVLQCVAVCCSMLQCSVLQCVCPVSNFSNSSIVRVLCVAVCCRVLQCAAECCKYQMWLSPVTHEKESCHIYKWVMSHVWTNYVTHVNEAMNILYHT